MIWVNGIGNVVVKSAWLYYNTSDFCVQVISVFHLLVLVIYFLILWLVIQLWIGNTCSLF